MWCACGDTTGCSHTNTLSPNFSVLTVSLLCLKSKTIHAGMLRRNISFSVSAIFPWGTETCTGRRENHVLSAESLSTLLEDECTFNLITKGRIGLNCRLLFLTWRPPMLPLFFNGLFWSSGGRSRSKLPVKPGTWQVWCAPHHSTVSQSSKTLNTSKIRTLKGFNLFRISWPVFPSYIVSTWKFWDNCRQSSQTNICTATQNHQWPILKWSKFF